MSDIRTIFYVKHVELSSRFLTSSKATDLSALNKLVDLPEVPSNVLTSERHLTLGISHRYLGDDTIHSGFYPSQ
ncbi:hypothetical protein CEXT_648321 [Caerostris extrusa]|uniref:Uncharacterized protein n=1 Tax=Caerostris extrusa TaxID=172846 RepID=A0AAV4XCQ1_CAEEX|nr:hypothetical protein CEXT_648321 [Caerostris extrusa]